MAPTPIEGEQVSTPTPMPALPGLPKFPAVVTIGLTVLDGALGLYLPYLSGPWKAADIVLAAILAGLGFGAITQSTDAHRQACVRRALNVAAARHAAENDTGSIG